jgi:hypothetical protein
MHSFFVSYLISVGQRTAVGYGAFVQFDYRLLQLHRAAESWDSPVSIVTGCELDRQESWVRFPPRTEICPDRFYRPSNVLSSWFIGISSKIKRPGRHAYYSIPSSIQFKNAWIYIFSSQYLSLAW